MSASQLSELVLGDISFSHRTLASSFETVGAMEAASSIEDAPQKSAPATMPASAMATAAVTIIAVATA